MPASRRSFLQLAGLGGLSVALPATNRPAPLAAADRPATPIRLSANENSYGPGERVLAVIREGLSRVNRYSFGTQGQLADALADSVGVPPAYVATSCGSSEILEAAVTAFTTPTRGLVTALPTFELPAGRARELGHPVTEVRVGDDLALDLEGMAAQAADAALVYVCNPNNPTGTVHGSREIARLVSQVHARAPEAIVLVDEAYHEYVERPDYRSAVEIALEDPRVVVSRTFSKIYGMAGMRVGYVVAHPGRLDALRPFLGGMTMSYLSGASALTALADSARVAEQRRLTREARAFTASVLREAGCRVIDSQANFLMADVGRDIRQFQRACRVRGVEIARPFPPLNTWARITIGTTEEMRAAAQVFRDALAEPVQSAAHLPPLVAARWSDAGRGC